MVKEGKNFIKVLRTTNGKGFTLIEVLVVAMLVGLLSYSFVELFNRDIDRNKREQTELNFKLLDDALKLHMEKVLAYRRKHNWELAPDCTWDRSWTLPNGCWNDNNYLYVWKDAELRDAFEKAGCKVVATTDDYYKMQCFDGWKTPLKFTFTNLDNTHAVPYDYRSPIKIKITSAGPDKLFGTSDDITYIFTSADLDNKYQTLTYEQMNNIRKALDDYFRYRFSVEVTERTYPDGLAELDDMKVDWYLQLCTDVPYEYCQDSTCSNISAHWGSYSCGNNPEINSCNIETILSNLNLPTEYKKDAFGNPIYINLCYDENGDGYPNGDSPSDHDDKGPFIATIYNGITLLVSSGM